LEKQHVSGRIGERTALTILLTGFSAFPGAPFNPTEALVSELQARKAYFAQRGIRLEPRVLPVIYTAIAPAIAAHVEELAPDVILHFGLATKRTRLSIETLARNRVNQIHCDAAGRQAEHPTVVRDGAPLLKARVPTVGIAVALRQAGHACDLSQDAGDYLCNAAFYLSLAAPHAAHVGFIHVPPLRQSNRHGSETREQSMLTMPQLLDAAEIIALTAARVANRSLQHVC
jgi:pyroglutamyl-peptidase